MRFIRSLGSFLGPAFIGFGIIMFLGLPIALPLSPVRTQDKPAPAATTSPNKVKGLTVPASIVITTTDVRKKIVPVFDDPSAVLDVKFKAISSGDTDPSFTVRGTGKDSYIEIDVPKDKEAILVITYALYGGDRPWITEAATTIVEWGSGLPPPADPIKPPVDPIKPPTDPVVPVTNVDQVFQSVKGIHAILVVDVQTANPEVAAITQNKTGIQKVIEKPNTGNKYWIFDVRDNSLRTQGVTKKLTDAQGKLLYPLPLVVLIDGSKTPATMIGQPLPIPLTGNPANTITQMLQSIAQALQRK